MRAEKAVEILRLHDICEVEGGCADLESAQQLGFEALQRVQEMRAYKTLIGLASSNPGRLLPSEDSQ